MRNLLVRARGVRSLDITRKGARILLWDEEGLVFESESEGEIIAFLYGILSFDTRDAFALAIVEARQDVSYALAQEVVSDILGRPTIAQMVRGI